MEEQRNVEMDKVFNPKAVEDRLYAEWEEKGYFKGTKIPGKKPFVIMMPPPNITGQLHMGHAMDALPQDALIRYHRMKGDPTLWLPGTDHASIATEVKLVDALKEEGKTKQDIGREEFLKRAWAWREKYGRRIVEQQKKLGASCDWSRERFTMDEGLNKAVVEVFVRLYEKGLIYRGNRLINWCPVCKTALSDAEVEYEEQDSHLWYIRYPGPEGKDIVVATSRPETMLGDSGVAVNPKDERYSDLVGKTVTLPIVNREIPVVADDYVEMEFGTGAVKNIRDWCISRQLWWGHRIPAYYCEDCGEMVVSRTEVKTCPKCGGAMHQDEDVLDTWFSSALWPFSTLGWPEQTEDLAYYYPTSVLVSGYDIIFFWVARMIFSGIEQMGETPFHTVLHHGLVRDAQGRKMSKSLGNGIDPLEMIDKYGCDALRFSLAMGVSPGNDVRFSDEKIEANRNFANKIWNAARFVMMNLKGWTPGEQNKMPLDPARLDITDRWILTRYQETLRGVTANMESLDLGLAAQKIYDFAWSSFCDWYIELAKPRLNGEDEAQKDTARAVLYHVLVGILKLLHPFMPFLTDEVYRYLPETDESIMISAWPTAYESLDFAEDAARMEGVMEIIRSVRNLRVEMNVAAGRRAHMMLRARQGWAEILASAEIYFKRMAYASEVEILPETAETPEKSASAVCAACEVFIPLGDLVDIDKEVARLEKDYANTEKEISRAEGKLNNPGFLNKAPEALVTAEREKLETNKAVLESLKARIAELQELKA